MVLFAIPMAVALSQCAGIFGCGWPRSSRVALKIILSWQLRNSAPSSASAADATTNLNIEHSIWKAPFNLMGSPSFGSVPMKKWPDALLCAFGSLRYDTSKWNIHHHVWCSKLHHRIWVCRQVIEDLVCLFQCTFHALCLFTCNCALRH